MILWDYIWHKIFPAIFPSLRWNRYGNIFVPVTTALCLSLFSPKGKTNSSLSLLRHVLGCKQAIYFSLMEGVNTVEPSFFKARQIRVTVEEGFAHRMFHPKFQATLTWMWTFFLGQSIWFYRDISFKAVLGFDPPGVWA